MVRRANRPQLKRDEQSRPVDHFNDEDGEWETVVEGRNNKDGEWEEFVVRRRKT